MNSSQLTEQLFRITNKNDLEQSLQVLLPDFLKLKIFFLKHQIAQYEMKWNMTYLEFEKQSVDMPNGFSQEVEQEYYDWGEKTALLEHYQKNLKSWI